MPNVIDGNQQTAQLISFDVLKNEIPITNNPNWNIDNSDFFGLNVDDYIIKNCNSDFNKFGQFSRIQKK